MQYITEGVTEPGLSGINAQPLSSPPVLRESESNTSVIVIEWGESPTSIATPILYEVEYTLTPFLQPTMDPVKEFVSLYLPFFGMHLVDKSECRHVKGRQFN